MVGERGNSVACLVQEVGPSLGVGRDGLLVMIIQLIWGLPCSAEQQEHPDGCVTSSPFLMGFGVGVFRAGCWRMTDARPPFICGGCLWSCLASFCVSGLPITPSTESRTPAVSLLCAPSPPSFSFAITHMIPKHEKRFTYPPLHTALRPSIGALHRQTAKKLGPPQKNV